MSEPENAIRLWCTGKRSALENTALDRLMVHSYTVEQQPILRLYSWEKSYTIGFSQKFENYTHLQSFSADRAKRITGGGVLFHGHDISYSLIIPTDFWGKLNVKETYEKICAFVMQFYKDLGLEACFAKDISSFALEKSDYCQSGTELYDITINGIKIGGNAQKRSRDYIFQHGSIPLSPLETTSNTISVGTSLEALGISLSMSEAEEKLIESFEKSFGVSLKAASLTPPEQEHLTYLSEKN